MNKRVLSTDLTTPTNETAKSWPFVTVLSTLACVVIFLGLAASNDYESHENLRRWGYVDSHSLWDGAYWGLFSSCFVHFGIIHLVFNVYWLWVLGGRFELLFGSFAYLAFFATAAFISSSFELAFSGSTGIGASGVGYALFGFAIVTRHKFPAFAAVLTNPMVALWLVWLAGCMVTTYLGIFPFGNAAHISGMIVGALIAAYFVLEKEYALPAIATMLVLSLVPPLWAPWSIGWLTFRADKSHQAGELEAAVDYYTRVIERDPDFAMAIWNRGCVYHDMELFEESKADLDRARAIDPDIERYR